MHKNMDSNDKCRTKNNITVLYEEKYFGSEFTVT